MLAFSWFFWGGEGPLQAADFAGGTLTVVRDAETADCPDESALGQATLALGTPPGERTDVAVSVVFQRDAFGYGALVTTSGTQAGVRELRKPGPTCAPLAEAVSVVLAVLFDLAPPREGASEPVPVPAPAPSAAPPAPPPPAARPPMPPPPPPSRPPRPQGSEVAAGVRAQGGVGYGLLGAAPAGAVSAALELSVGRWEPSAGALWAPNRSVDYAPGVVHVSVLAGRLAGCGWFFPSRSRPDLALCAGLLLGRVRGEGEGFDGYRPPRTNAWLAAEAGAAGRLPLTANLALRLGIFVLMPSRRQTFTVGGAGTAFRSSSAAGLLELGPELRFW